MTKKELRPRPISPNTLFLAAAVLLAILAAFSFYRNYTDLPFDEVRWQESTGRTRGRMLADLFHQTSFVGADRATVERALGSPEFDERLVWYDLGPYDEDAPVDPRGDVGPRGRLFAVFRFKSTGALAAVVYNHRRPVLGSDEFDRELWDGPDRTSRAMMMITALGMISVDVGPAATARVYDLLGEPDGERTRGYYDVGSAGKIFGRQNSLVLEYDDNGTVTAASLER